LALIKNEKDPKAKGLLKEFLKTEKEFKAGKLKWTRDFSELLDE